MKKSIIVLILAGTLAIGFGLGFLVCTKVMHHKVKGWHDKFQGHGIKEMVYHRLKITDEQKGEIGPIIDKYAVELREAHENDMKDHEAIWKNMREEIIPFLNEQQVEKAKNWRDKWNKKRSHHKKQHQRDHKKQDKYDKEKSDQRDPDKKKKCDQGKQDQPDPDKEQDDDQEKQDQPDLDKEQDDDQEKQDQPDPDKK